MSCIFCDIIAGEAQASFVYQDDLCVAFMDTRPLNPGHILVVPKAHSSSLAELSADTGGHLFKVSQILAAALRESGLRCEGVNLFLSDGVPAGQTIFHVHLHLVPRFRGDGFGFKFNPANLIHPPRAELEMNAEQIRAAYR